MSKILMENALESWANAINYCEKLMKGRATLSNKKFFVSSLHNAIELFAKQYMLDSNDYRVVTKANGIDVNGSPLKEYFESNDLNSFFITIESDKRKKFFTLEFSKIIDYQKDLFKKYYEWKAKELEGSGEEERTAEKVKTYLTTLKKLRNDETHFYITDDEFLSDLEFRDLYNLMVEFSKILDICHLLPWFGEATDKYKRFLFEHEVLDSFSYKKQLKTNPFVIELKKNIEVEIYPAGGGEESYSITEDIIAYTEVYKDIKFDELWEYVQVLLKYKMLKIKNIDEGVINDDENEYSAYRQYKIEL